MGDSPKRMRTKAKAKFTWEIRKLEEAIEDDYPLTEIEKQLEAINTAADAVEEAHDEYVQSSEKPDPEADDWIDSENERARAATKKVMKLKTGSVSSVTSSVQTPSKVKLKAMDYPIFDGCARKYQEWRREYDEVIKPRLQGASDAEISMCLLGCLSKTVKEKLTPDCKTEVAILQELNRQYGVKDRVINQIIEDVLEIQTPNVHDPVKCAVFYRSILSAVNDLADFKSEECLKNPAIIATLVKKLPSVIRDKWWETVYSLNSQVISDEEKPETFITFIKWQLNIADEMAALQLSSDIQSKHTQSVKKVSTKVSQSSQLTKQKISVGSSQVCQVCSTGVHPIWHCQQFRSMSPKQRNSSFRTETLFQVFESIKHFSVNIRIQGCVGSATVVTITCCMMTLSVVKYPLRSQNQCPQLHLHEVYSIQYRCQYSSKFRSSNQLTKQKISVGSSQVCQVCSTGVHPIWHCQQFRSMSPKQRNSKVLELKLCFKCLKASSISVST